MLFLPYHNLIWIENLEIHIISLSKNATSPLSNNQITYKFYEQLQQINQNLISINLNEKNKPILIQGIGDPSFKYLVMPVTR